MTQRDLHVPVDNLPLNSFFSAAKTPRRLAAIRSYQHSEGTRDKSIDMDFSISPFQMLLSRKAKRSLIALRAAFQKWRQECVFL